MNNVTLKIQRKNTVFIDNERIQTFKEIIEFWKMCICRH